MQTLLETLRGVTSVWERSSPPGLRQSWRECWLHQTQSELVQTHCLTQPGPAPDSVRTGSDSLSDSNWDHSIRACHQYTYAAQDSVQTGSY